LQLALQGSNLLHARPLESALPYGEDSDRSVMVEVFRRR
jgi:hypothetical protein